MTKFPRLFQPLGAFVLLFSLALTGCDTVLETFYPELRQGGGGSAQLTLNLSFQKTLAGTVAISLVPYNFDAVSQQDIAQPEFATTVTFEPSQQSSTTYTTKFTILGGQNFRLLAYVLDGSAAQQPRSDFTQATLIEVGGKKLFRSNDLPSGGNVKANLTATSTLSPGIYAEIWGGTSGSDSWWVEGPQFINLGGTNPVFTTADVALVRPFSYNLKSIQHVVFSVQGPKSLPNTLANPVGPTDRFPLSYNGTFQFDAAGSYTVNVSYWYDSDTYGGVNSASPNQSLSYIVSAFQGGGGTGELADGELYNLSVTINPLPTGGYAYAYFYDPYGNYVSSADLRDTDTTVSFGPVPYYSSASYPSHGSVQIWAYDANGNSLYASSDQPGYATSLKLMTGATALNLPFNFDFSVFGGNTGLPNGSLYRIDLNLAPGTWGFGDGDTVLVKVYDPVANRFIWNQNMGMEVQQTVNYADPYDISPIVFTGIDSSYQFSYHAGIADEVWVFVNGVLEGKIPIQGMQAGQTVFTAK